MVIARPVKGKNRNLKTRISLALFAFYFALPFMKINGNQSLLLDITERRFYIFGLIVGPNEMYFLHLTLLFLGIMLFFATAVWGRIWCGWACPQTVFTEAYDFVGRLVAGKSFGKKSMTWFDWSKVYAAWIVISLVFNYNFISYFAGADYMWERLSSLNFSNDGDPSWPLGNWVMGTLATAAISFVNMFYFRENTCRLVCPYGRFQTALLDKDSPIVTYDIKRGEPRRAKGQKEGEGDCTACNMCNAVCPTGIDIREGLQIGCITCGLCVDACTIEMGKKSKGTLIDWKTIAQSTDPTAVRKIWHPRVVIYAIILAVIVSLFTYRVVTRIPIQAIPFAEPSTFKQYLPTVGMKTDYSITLTNFYPETHKIRIEVVSEDPNVKLMSDLVAGQKYFEAELESTKTLKPRLPVVYAAPTPQDIPADKEFAKFKFKVYAVDKSNNVKWADALIRLK